MSAKRSRIPPKNSKRTRSNPLMYSKLLVILLIIDKIYGEEICAKTKITARWPNGTNECFPCVTCRRGWGATYSCGDVVNAPLQTPIKCLKCKKRETFSTGRSSDSCKKCTTCRSNYQIIKKCTRSADTKCGGCKRGYYSFRGPHFSSCEKCSACCGDAKDERIEECAKQGLARHLRCSSRQDRNCDPDLPKSSPMVRSSKTSTSNKTMKSTADHKPTTSPATLQVTENQKTKVSKGTAKPAAAANHQTITINNTNAGLTTAAIIVIVVVLVIMLLIVWYIRRRRNSTSVKSSTSTDCEPRHVNSDDDEKQPLNDRKENENEPPQVPSCLLKEFIEDQDERSVYENCCRQLNTAKHPDMKEHFCTLSRACDIDFDIAKKLMEDQEQGSAQALFGYIGVTGKEISLEQIARVLDCLPGRAPVAKMLREADDRLKQKSSAQQQGT